MSSAMTPAGALALLLLVGGACAQVRYFGKEVGPLAQLQHGVRGTVYAVDSRTIYLRDFHYDGEGPAAYFYVGSSGSASAGVAGALRMRDERGGAGPLRRYRGESVTLSLPDGKTLRDFKWFAVYCDEYSVNFGDVSIPRELEFPRPAKVGALRGVHGVHSDPIVVVDAQTLLVPNFSYDGEAPDAKFWVGRGDKPSPQGIRIPDENGKEAPLRKYDRKTIVLTLPGELTVFDIGHFAVWCEAFTVNFGHVTLPRAALSAVPPSLKMLGVSPQSRNNALVGGSGDAASSANPTSSPRSRGKPRRPIARLEATTYRPSARLPPAADLAALLDAPADRLPLHRRADSYTPPAQQLVTIQSSKELPYKEDGTIDLQEVQQQQQHDLQQRLQQGLQNLRRLQQQQQELERQQQHQQHFGAPQQQHQQGPGLKQHQEYQQLLQQQQQLQQRQEHIDQQRKLLNEQIYYNQQQQSEELQLAAQRRPLQPVYSRSEEPLQYRLLPYSGRA